jgi:hypothetical protein
MSRIRVRKNMCTAQSFVKKCIFVLSPQKRQISMLLNNISRHNFLSFLHRPEKSCFSTKPSHAHRTWRCTRATFFQNVLAFRNMFSEVGSYVPGFIHVFFDYKRPIQELRVEESTSRAEVETHRLIMTSLDYCWTSRHGLVVLNLQ